MSAEISATPTVDKIIPKAPPARPFVRLPVDKEAISDSPKTDSQKYSIGPNASATFDNGGASSKSAKAPTKPPKTDAKQANATAKSPSPFFAIGYPSNVVAIAEGVPGVFSKMAAYAPP